MKRLGDIWIIVGTRPECIKQAPVFSACGDALGADHVSLVGTGQHRDLLQTALDDFGLTLDVNFDIMRPEQSLPKVMAAVLTQFEELVQRRKPERVVVQGDTTTACAAALAAFQMGIEVAHNEAGLRSNDLKNPFPEEANRRIISSIADLHFAPTELAEAALLREGVSKGRIHVVGNTGIDSLFHMLEQEPPGEVVDLVRRIKATERKIVLLTAHRREAKGAGMESLFRALKQFLSHESSVAVVYPVHPNALGEAAAQAHISDLTDQVHIVPPMSYRAICHVMSESYFLVTDSGGIQEEGATLGIPTVVCRRVTERRVAVEVGIARVAGLETEGIIAALEWAYKYGQRRKGVWTARPFGDGTAGARIAAVLAAAKGRQTL